MRDNEGREIEYLRLSVTDRCNLRCVYCMPEEGVENASHLSILTYEEMVRICRVFAKHGLKHIKITGGEPLVRKGVVGLVRCLKAIDGIESVTLTTNGVLLEKYYDELVDAGIDTITVSLDTLDSELFQRITRRDALESVLSGVKKAIEANRLPFKINCVPIRELNAGEICELVSFAKNHEVDVRFIEMMPIGYGSQFEYVSEEVIKRVIEDSFGPMTACFEKRGNGPAVYYDVSGFKGKIGLISAVSHGFCHTCNRVRLTAEGYLKTCLQYDYGVDLKELLRRNLDDDTLWLAMERAIFQKPKAHHFKEKERTEDDELRGMSQIGG